MAPYPSFVPKGHITLEEGFDRVGGEMFRDEWNLSDVLPDVRDHEPRNRHRQRQVLRAIEISMYCDNAFGNDWLASASRLAEVRAHLIAEYGTRVESADSTTSDLGPLSCQQFPGQEVAISEINWIFQRDTESFVPPFSPLGRFIELDELFAIDVLVQRLSGEFPISGHICGCGLPEINGHPIIIPAADLARIEADVDAGLEEGFDAITFAQKRLAAVSLWLRRELFGGEVRALARIPSGVIGEVPAQDWSRAENDPINFLDVEQARVFLNEVDLKNRIRSVAAAATRQARDGLPHTSPSAAKGRRRQARYSIAELERWYGTVYLPDCLNRGRIPTRDEDIRAAKAALGEHIPERAIREVRKKLAPASWAKSGRRRHARA